jgi:hypothetical protein
VRFLSSPCRTGCCADGLRCVERDPYFAQCVERCPISSSWTCVERFDPHHFEVDSPMLGQPSATKMISLVRDTVDSLDEKKKARCSPPHLECHCILECYPSVYYMCVPVKRVHTTQLPRPPAGALAVAGVWACPGDRHLWLLLHAVCDGSLGILWTTALEAPLSSARVCRCSAGRQRVGPQGVSSSEICSC